MIINIDLNNLLISLVIGVAAGFIASNLFGRRNGSILSNLVLGLAGALIGGALLPAIGLRPWGFVGSFLTAMIGAIIILMIGRVLVGKSYNRF